MDYFSLIGAGLAGALDPHALLAMAAGIPFGLVFGLVPGLSGLTALAILLPFVYGMEPLTGLAMLMSAHAVIYTGGSVTAVILGIPGAPPNAATVIDGYPLARQGRGGYAMGAALCASGLGGVFGALVLVALLPVLEPIVLSFGSPETFFLALTGIAFIAVVGEGPKLKGIIAGGIGIFLATFGYQKITGVPRFWLGSDYLLDGFRLIPLALGLFAIPEIIQLAAKGETIAESGAGARISMAEVRDGCLAVLRHWKLFLKSSVLGTVVGVIPGVGGETAPFVAYAAAKQAARDPSAFGRGAIEGVIAPEASNNAKEGGALVPTLAFGIPGSAGMALLLGAFLILGLEPGPDFLKKRMDVAAELAFILAIANVLAAVVMIALARHFARITQLRGHVLAPILIAVVVLGTYASKNEPMDVIAMFAFGALGWVLKELRYSRPALILGFVLGEALETYFHISLRADGPLFFTRPISLAIIALLALGVSWPSLARRLRRRPR